jgi:hypothetical protein
LRWNLTRPRTLIDTPDGRTIIADRENVGLNRDGVAVDILSIRDAVPLVEFEALCRVF